MKVKITDKKHKYYNQELEGSCIYYDYQHTGNSPDIYVIKTPEGEKQILSTQIDVAHYENQRLEATTKQLGANVGDTVKIIKEGSSSSRAGFVVDDPHVITKIEPSGHVTFDDGMACMFRPTVEKISQPKDKTWTVKYKKLPNQEIFEMQTVAKTEDDARRLSLMGVGLSNIKNKDVNTIVIVSCDEVNQ